MAETQTTAERLFALIFANIGYTDGDDRTVASIAAEIDAKDAKIAMLEAELEARRVVMAEQERIANMPRAYSAGG